MKKIITIILSATFFALSLISVYASPVNEEANLQDINIIGIDIPTNTNPGSTVSPQYEPACGTGPHTMFAHGWGDIYDVDKKTTIVKNGACAQCSKCYLVIVTQNEPDGTNPIGYYTTWKIDYELTSYVTVIRQSTKNIIYTSSTRIPGISFRYH